MKQIAPQLLGREKKTYATLKELGLEADIPTRKAGDAKRYGLTLEEYESQLNAVKPAATKKRQLLNACRESLSGKADVLASHINAIHLGGTNKVAMKKAVDDFLANASFGRGMRVEFVVGTDNHLIEFAGTKEVGRKNYPGKKQFPVYKPEVTEQKKK